MSLSATEVQKTKPGDKPYKLFDGGGLFLLVTPQGGKLWRFKYRFDRKEKQMPLGGWPDVSLAEARNRHLSARQLLASDVDPMAKRKAEKEAKADTFEAIAWQWFETWKHGKSERYVIQQESRLKANILPSIGSRPIAKIEAPEVIAMAKIVEQRGAHELAHRTLEVVKRIFSYAIQHGLATRNPAAEVKPANVLKAKKKQSHLHIGFDELPELLAAIDGYHGEHTRLAMWLLTYTFVRTSELIGARWSEIDLDGATWDIPASRMKMKRPHLVPLSRQAVAVFEQLRKMTAGEYVFPGNAGKPHMSNGTILLALDRMGYRGRMTGHGFRHVASTRLHENDFNGEWIEMQLSHAKADGVAAAYNKAKYIKQRRTMLQTWADLIDSQRAKAQPAALVAD